MRNLFIMVYHLLTIIRNTSGQALPVFIILVLAGCPSFSPTRETEIQADSTLERLNQVEQVEEPNIPIPSIYKSPPKVVKQKVGGDPEWKLFYFCKYHTSDYLKKIIHEQFATRLFSKEQGRRSKSQNYTETTVPDYTVSSNTATNQLIVRCPARDDIDAVLELIKQVDIPPVQVKINCLVSEVYADKTMDRETTIQISEFLGEDIAMKPSAVPFGDDVQKLIGEGEDIPPAFPGASLREVAREKIGLKVGYLSEKYNVLVDILESKGYLKILMNPTLEVVNGQTARVESSQHVPLQRITRIYTGEADLAETETKYVDVIDSLEITPHVFADGYIGLETKIVLGSKSTPEGVKQIPILTKKQIENKENRIRQGESLIIGGLRKSEKRSVIRGFPILKDIPILGMLFSAKDYENRAVETVFILTPTVSTGGLPKEEVYDNLRQIHHPNAPEGGMSKNITDPFGIERKRRRQEKKLEDIMRRLSRAQNQREEARSLVRETEARIEELKRQAEKAGEKASKADTSAKKANDKAKKLQNMLDELQRKIADIKSRNNRG